MSESLIINFASRGRPQQFLKSLQNITDTISTNNYRILISADLDDTEMNCDAMCEKISEYPHTEVYYNEPTSKIGAINATVPHFGDFYWLINFSDDFVFRVDGWDQKILQQIKYAFGDSTDFLAHFHDPYIGDRLPTMAIMGKAFFDRFGCVYEKSYNSICCDAEQFMVSQMLGCYKYFPETYFSHEHPANVPSIIIDQTYRRNDKFGKADEANYFERMSYGFHIENPVLVPAEVQEHIQRRIQNEQSI